MVQARQQCDDSSVRRLEPADFADAVRRTLESPPAGADPWVLSFYRDLRTEAGMRRFSRAHQQLISLAGGVVGRDVVDAGSGFGMAANLIASWGARRVHAIELLGSMVDTHRRILTRDFPHLQNVCTIRGDVGAIPLVGQSVDLVLSVEAISHYFALDAFLDESARVLRRGGTLLVSDANNGANPRVRAATEEIWQRWEHGPHGHLDHHDITDTFVERRARIVRERFPALPADHVELYAAATSGFDRGEVETAVRRHLDGGPRPASFYKRGDLPRDPDNGTVAERLFDPIALGREIEKRGFNVRVLAHFGGARNDLFRAANAVLRWLPLFRYAPAFRIVAVKR